ncbi:MAG: hypothetical protein J0I40_02740 [Cellulomonas sp.]|uniref:hypothetical protein n=1 Tax=Cellulomonas sp. 73-92 TaxID=1895740 RepID=UPI000926AE09|nr:hypothetical protein [Cellulomonas sp. 73-92]MBN9374310.1 hypothetical protein [Cellulomonas sp.]OJV76522.1 MAG: hypothetical protein BGO37_10725 [Cellulomonas sp. 73-92]
MDAEPLVESWWVVMQRDGAGAWQPHASRPRSRTEAEQFAADLNVLGSTRERGLLYAAASVTVLAEAHA